MLYHWTTQPTSSSLDGVAPSQMVGVSASVNLPLHHKVQKFFSGTGSPGWSWKKGRKNGCIADRLSNDTVRDLHCPHPCRAYEKGNEKERRKRRESAWCTKVLDRFSGEASSIMRKWRSSLFWYNGICCCASISLIFWGMNRLQLTYVKTWLFTVDYISVSFSRR